MMKEVKIEIKLPNISEEEYSEMSKRMTKLLSEKAEWILDTADQLKQMEKKELEKIKYIVSNLSDNNMEKNENPFKNIMEYIATEKSKSYDDGFDRGKREGRREVLEEIKVKFADGVLIGMDGDKVVAVSNPQFDMWLKKELSKLRSKDNGQNN